MNVRWEGARFGDGVFIEPHPRLEPMKRATRVSRDNAQMWLDFQDEMMESGGLKLAGWQRRPGSWPTFVYQPKEEEGSK